MGESAGAETELVRRFGMTGKEMRFSPIIEAVWAAILLLLCGILVVAANATGVDVNADLVSSVSTIL